MPLVVALLSMPAMVKELGLERFGVLTLLWMAIGYFSLFDAGLSRALTKIAAEKLGAEREQEIPGFIWTALLIMAILGVLGATILGLISPWLVLQVFKIPDGLREETRESFFLLSLVIPILTCTSGLRGLLEAYQRFGVVNVGRNGMALLTFLGPLLVVQFSRNLVPVVAVLELGCLFECMFYLFLCARIMAAWRREMRIQRGAIGPLFRFGGWITVSNFVGPIMVYFDRFLISVSISMAAVAYYVTPYETVTKLWFIPGAMAGVLFPVFSTISRQEPERAAFFFGHGVKSVFLVLFPITLLIVSLGHEGLDLWMGKEFADHSTRVLQWLTMGVFANSLAQIPYAFIQGLGRPDVTAKLHLLELPFYLIALGWLMGVYGIEGAGMVWFGRALLDAILLFWMARRLRPETADFIGRMAWLSAAGLLILSVPLLPISSLVNRVFFLFMLLGFPLVAWLFIPVPEKSRRNQ